MKIPEGRKKPEGNKEPQSKETLGLVTWFNTSETKQGQGKALHRHIPIGWILTTKVVHGPGSSGQFQ